MEKENVDNTNFNISMDEQEHVDTQIVRNFNVLGNQKSDTYSQTASKRTRMWFFFGSEIPKDQVVYLLQMFIGISIIVASVINLSIGDKAIREVWIALLSSTMGYMLPTPGMKTKSSLDL